MILEFCEACKILNACFSESVNSVYGYISAKKNQQPAGVKKLTEVLQYFEGSIGDEDAVGRVAGSHPCHCNSLQEGGAKDGVEDEGLVALANQPHLVLLGLVLHQV